MLLSKMPRFLGRVAPVIRQAVAVRNRCIQRFVQIERVNAHEVHVDVRVSRAIWHFDAVEYMDAAPFAKRMMRHRVVAAVLCQFAFTGKQNEVVRPNLDEPEPQFAAEVAVALCRAFADIDPGFKLHRLAMATSRIGSQHQALPWSWIASIAGTIVAEMVVHTALSF
jgi:hypothetical protein